MAIVLLRKARYHRILHNPLPFCSECLIRLTYRIAAHRWLVSLYITEIYLLLLLEHFGTFSRPLKMFYSCPRIERRPL